MVWLGDMTLSFITNNNSTNKQFIKGVNYTITNRNNQWWTKYPYTENTIHEQLEKNMILKRNSSKLLTHIHDNQQWNDTHEYMHWIQNTDKVTIQWNTKKK